MTWKTETLEDGRETYQLHVRVDRLVVERHGNYIPTWKWAALDGDGRAIAVDPRYQTRHEAEIGATMWLRDYSRKLYEQTVGTQP
jgi:hypothetical protein